MIWLIAGCFAPGDLPADDRVLPELSPPSISAAALVCDADDARWRLDATATSWTGGGDLFWTVDGDYIEQHRVRSVSAAPDGSADTLRLELSLAADWREVTSGSSTAFGCSEDPAWRLMIYDTAGEPTDCASGGDPSLWADTDASCDPAP